MTREEYKKWLQDRIKTAETLNDADQKAIPYQIEVGNYHAAQNLFHAFEARRSEMNAFRWALEQCSQITD